MKYKEFEKKTEDWGIKYNYATEVEIGDFKTYIKVRTNKISYSIASISNKHQLVLDTDWVTFLKIKTHARAELLDILVDLAKTPPEDREDEKRFIIPLPELITTDGKLQYLTYKDCFFFASRRNEDLRQIWREEHLKFVPEIYRQFAVEIEEEGEY